MRTGKFAVHHLGVAVVDIESALEFYQTALGFTLNSKVFCDPIQKVKVCFLTNEPGRSLCVELISPLEAASPVNGFLSKGIGAYHVCYEVGNLEGAMKDLRAKGCVLIAPPVPAVAFDGRRIAWCLTPTRLLVELLESELPTRSE
jgi:methylmalonyl-CoA/ethylmalonyl-CoA epimerase